MRGRTGSGILSVALLLGCSGFALAQLQPPPRPMAASETPPHSGVALESAVEARRSPDWEVYELFFRHLSTLEKVADQEEALGRESDAASWRSHERRAAGLNEDEGEILKEVAADCVRAVDERNEKLSSLARSLRTAHIASSRESLIAGNGPLPDALAEIISVLQEKTRIVESHVDQLRGLLGEESFSKLDRFVLATFEPGVTLVAPEASPAGSSIKVHSHTTVQNQQAVSTCGSSMTDAFTIANYVSVAATCTFKQSGTAIQTFSCVSAKPQTTECSASEVFPTVAGNQYSTTAQHSMNMYFDSQYYCPQIGYAWGYYDPVHYAQPAWVPVSSYNDFLESGDSQSRGAPICWSLGNAWVDFSHSQTVTSIRVDIQPLGKEVLPGLTQPFTSTITPSTFSQAVTWSASPESGGSIDTKGVFTAAAGNTSPQTVTVSACSTVEPAACAQTTFTVPQIVINVQGTSPMLAVAGATENLAAIVQGTSQALEVVWPKLPAAQGALDFTGTSAVYTAPSGITSATVVPITVCLKDVSAICGTLNLQLVPPVVIGGINPNVWSSGQHDANQPIQIAISGTGFGTSPKVTLSDPTIVFAPTAAGPASIQGIVSTPLMPQKTVTVTVTAVTDGLSASASATVTVTSPTLGASISPKTIALQETQTQQFGVSATCRTGSNFTCLEPYALSWRAAKGTISSTGLYTATASVSAQTTDTVTVCATWAGTLVACDTATVVLVPIIVTVSPSNASLSGCDSAKFSQSVAGASVSTVTWSSSPAVGTIDAKGVYKSPCPFPGPAATVTVTACSIVDGARCGTATVSLTPLLSVGSISPINGPMAGGTTVIITGTGFAAGATVSIGGTPATSVTVVSPSQITAVTGAHACGGVDVVVTQGTASTRLAGGFTYNSPQPPTGLAPNGTTLPATTTSLTLSWAAVSGATQYAVRVQDNTDGTIRDPRNNCANPTVDLCVDGVPTTTYSVPVQAGHSYTWWVHAGSSCGQYSPQTTATFSVAPPVDNAAFISQVAPPSCLFPSSAVTVSVVMRNTGTTTWDSNYRLGSQNPQDNSTWGLGRVFLAPGQTVPPGAQVTFSFTATMPSTAGNYNFQWRMVHEMVQWFGDFTPNVMVTSLPPSPPTGLTPNGVAVAAGTTSLTLSWSPTPGATRYAVRVQDNTDGSVRGPNNCPGNPAIYVCVNDITTTTYTVTVQPGHSYTWWVHAGNCTAYSNQTTATFSVPVTPLHAPTGLFKEASPSRNLDWTPPDNLTSADQATYDLWIYGGTNCASGCLYHPAAPSWYTMGAEIVSGSYTWTLKANSVSRPSSPAVSGPPFAMP